MLARAGLARIGRLDAVTEVIDPLQMLPAPGQGALAVECRASDDVLVTTLAAALDDSGSRAAVVAERAFLAAVQTAGAPRPSAHSPTSPKTSCTCAESSPRSTAKKCSASP